MPRRAATAPVAMPLYPSESRVARAVLGEERAKDWPSIAAHDERNGLPKVDPVHGGRYWPAVQKFYETINRVDAEPGAVGPSVGPRVRLLDNAPDGREDFRGEKDAALRHRRRERRPLRARA